MDELSAIAARVTLAGDGYLARLLAQGPVVFEGAQGVLLDEWRGFHPYTTWSTTTFENAETLLGESGAAAVWQITAASCSNDSFMTAAPASSHAAAPRPSWPA